MIMPSRRSSAPGVAILIFLCPSGIVAEEDEWKQRFFSDGVSQLQELEELTFWLQAKMHQVESSKNGTGSFDRECCFQGSLLQDIVKLNWNWNELPEERQAQLPVEVAAGVNSHYEFRLRRLKSGPFTLTEYNSPGDCARKFGPYSFFYARSLSAGWILYQRPFREWLQLDGFVVENVEAKKSPDGGTWVTVRVSYSAEKTAIASEIPNDSFHAEVLMDPDNHWCIQSVHYLFSRLNQEGQNYKLSKHVAIDYGPTVDGKPVPKFVRETLEYPPTSGMGGTVIYESDIHDVKQTGEIDEDQFTLSRFGLPEPPGVEWEKPTPWYLWLGVGGIGCLVLGAGFFWLKQRGTQAV